MYTIDQIEDIQEEISVFFENKLYDDYSYALDTIDAIDYTFSALLGLLRGQDYNEDVVLVFDSIKIAMKTIEEKIATSKRRDSVAIGNLFTVDKRAIAKNKKRYEQIGTFITMVDRISISNINKDENIIRLGEYCVNAIINMLNAMQLLIARNGTFDSKTALMMLNNAQNMIQSFQRGL